MVLLPWAKMLLLSFSKEKHWRDGHSTVHFRLRKVQPKKARHNMMNRSDSGSPRGWPVKKIKSLQTVEERSEGGGERKKKSKGVN